MKHQIDWRTMALGLLIILAVLILAHCYPDIFARFQVDERITGH